MPAAIHGFHASASLHAGIHVGHGVMMAATNTGTQQMRTSVTTFAGVHSLSFGAPRARVRPAHARSPSIS